jgi:hypothetical protein
MALTGAWLLVLSTGPVLAGPTVEVPEPSSMLLLAAGLGGAAWIKLRGPRK